MSGRGNFADYIEAGDFQLRAAMAIFETPLAVPELEGSPAGPISTLQWPDKTTDRGHKTEVAAQLASSQTRT
jgi:hypothetical protein